MQIAFDATKDAANLAKHGLSLAWAQRIDWLTGLVRPAKTIRGEARWQWVGAVDGVLYSVIFTARATVDFGSSVCAVRAARSDASMKGKQRPGVPDDENPAWTAEDFRAARPFGEVFPDLAAPELKRGRGPQKTPTKRPISLRVDPDVLAAYRATGKGWQARMNETLAAHAPNRAKGSRATRPRRAKRTVRRVS